ncbi:MAG TPA: hypothetical protein VGO48_13685 [Conexibacter sp.]|jgi:hypothetical protein|nr:hypothetical protein [Conexibacter sp.]
MEWVSVAVWALVALVALPVASGAFVAPPLGLQPIVGVAGLVLSVLFAVNGNAPLAWIAGGLALLGAVTTGVGAAELIGGEDSDVGRAEEHAATFAGLAWPLYAVAIGMSVLAALAADSTI